MVWQQPQEGRILGDPGFYTSAQVTADGTEQTLHFANLAVRETHLRALYGPVRWNTVVARIRFGVVVEAFEKDDSGAWIPLRLRAWELANVQACVSFCSAKRRRTTWCRSSSTESSARPVEARC